MFPQCCEPLQFIAIYTELGRGNNLLPPRMIRQINLVSCTTRENVNISLKLCYIFNFKDVYTRKTTGYYDDFYVWYLRYKVYICTISNCSTCSWMGVLSVSRFMTLLCYLQREKLPGENERNLKMLDFIHESRIT